MFRSVLKYSFKVWITSAASSPIIWGIVSIFYDGGTNFKLSEDSFLVIPYYILFVGIELVVSLLIWILFTAIILFIVNIISSKPIQRLLIFFSGIALTVLTFVYFGSVFASDFSWNDSFAWFMYCVAATISWGAWFYDLKIPDKKIEQTETNPGNF